MSSELSIIGACNAAAADDGLCMAQHVRRHHQAGSVEFIRALRERYLAIIAMG